MGAPTCRRRLARPARRHLHPALSARVHGRAAAEHPVGRRACDRRPVQEHGSWASSGPRLRPSPSLAAWAQARGLALSGADRASCSSRRAAEPERDWQSARRLPHLLGLMAGEITGEASTLGLEGLLRRRVEERTRRRPCVGAACGFGVPDESETTPGPIPDPLVVLDGARELRAFPGSQTFSSLVRDRGWPSSAWSRTAPLFPVRDRAVVEVDVRFPRATTHRPG